MEVVFKNRDFSGRLAPPESVEITVERYSWDMAGGPERAYLKASAGADKWDLLKFLRAPIEIWDGGDLMWWGFVNKITAPNGEAQRVGLGLDEFYNYVVVAYDGADTSAASDSNSIAEYGQKEVRISTLNATQTEGEQTRDLYLTDHKYPRPEIEFSGGNNEIIFECYGWYSTLDWKYYTDADTTNTENTTQISNIVASAGQFLAGTIIEDLANITSTEERDGKSTALRYVDQLLNAGTTNVRPLLATVDSNRYLHVYERQVEPPVDNPEFLLRSDGRLVDPLGVIVPDRECKVAAWVKVKDVPDQLGGFSSLRPFFIENAEYNVAQDRTTYRAANAYEQIRLAKYIAEVAGTDGNSRSYPGYTPAASDPISLDTYILTIYDPGSSPSMAIIDISGFATPGDIDEIVVPSGGLYILHYTLYIEKTGAITGATPGTISITLTYPNITGNSGVTWKVPHGVSGKVDHDVVRIFRATASGSAYAWVTALTDVDYDTYYERLEIVRLGD